MLLLWMIGKMLVIFFDFFLTTAVYDYLSMNAEGYNEGNEQYAYLVTWCVEQLEDFIECKRKEKRMIRKMAKQDGN